MSSSGFAVCPPDDASETESDIRQYRDHDVIVASAAPLAFDRLRLSGHWHSRWPSHGRLAVSTRRSIADRAGKKPGSMDQVDELPLRGAARSTIRLCRALAPALDRLAFLQRGFDLGPRHGKKVFVFRGHLPVRIIQRERQHDERTGLRQGKNRLIVFALWLNARTQALWDKAIASSSRHPGPALYQFGHQRFSSQLGYGLGSLPPAGGASIAGSGDVLRPMANGGVIPKPNSICTSVFCPRWSATLRNKTH